MQKCSYRRTSKKLKRKEENKLIISKKRNLDKHIEPIQPVGSPETEAEEGWLLKLKNINRN